MVLNYHGIERGPHCKRNITEKNIVGFALAQLSLGLQMMNSSLLGLKSIKS